jgi:hypothetical protein
MIEASVILSVLGLFYLWSQWKKAALDDCRDKLFDLRRSLRDYFHERGEVGHPLYRELRDMLNSHIRFTEQYTLLTVLIVARNVKSLAQARSTSLISKYENSDYKDIIEDTRTQSLQCLGGYLVETNFLLSAFSNVLLIWSLFSRHAPARNTVLNKIVRDDQIEGISISSYKLRIV